MSRETQDTIAQWAKDTFGGESTFASVAARANVEMAELLQLLTILENSNVVDISKKPKLLHDIALECADVKIVLARCAVLARIDMQSAIAAERMGNMTIRDWFGGSVLACARSAASLGIALIDEKTVNLPHIAIQQLGMLLARLHLITEYIGEGPLDDLVDEKMIVNRARKWKLDGHGHGQHES